MGRALEELDAAVTALGPGAPGWADLRRQADRLADEIATQVRIEALALFPRALELDRRL